MFSVATSDCKALSSKLDTCPKPVAPVADAFFSLAIASKPKLAFTESIKALLS
jgi:hypothetical protein